MSGLWFVLILAMKIMLASGDSYLKATIENIVEQNSNVSFIFQDDFEPVKILSNFLNEQPSILIIDDDYLTPGTLSILESIYKLNKKSKIIFTTSDVSIELGKQVSQLGIYFYAIKPINKDEFIELLDSVINHNKQKYNLN